MDYERVCAANEVARGSVLAREINGRPVAVVHCEDGTYHAVADECTHQEIPLSEGTVEGCTLECWLHGSRFDLRTGEPIGLPATEPVTADAVPASELPPVAICPVVEVGERHTNLSVLSSVNGAGRLSTFSAGEVTGSLDFRTGGTGAVTVAAAEANAPKSLVPSPARSARSRIDSNSRLERAATSRFAPSSEKPFTLFSPRRNAGRPSSRRSRVES